MVDLDSIPSIADLQDIQEPRPLLKDETGTWYVVPLSHLVEADWNYKEMDETTTRKLKNNLARIGQVENLLTREFTDEEIPTTGWEVLNGNHRLREMGDLGKTVAVVYHFGKVARQEAIRLAVETNETKIHADYFMLSERMGEVIDFYGIDAIEETMPFERDELNTFYEDADFDYDNFAFDPSSENITGEDEDDLERFEVAMRPAHMDEFKDALEQIERENGQEMPDEAPERRGLLIYDLACRYLYAQQTRPDDTPDRT